MSLYTPSLFAFLLMSLLVIVLFTEAEGNRYVGNRRGLFFYRPAISSGRKRNQLPYHPLARFKGADSKPYSPLSYSLPELIQQISPEGDDKLSAGELLSLLTHVGLRTEPAGGRVAGTMRFGILRRRR